jgi:1-acyl-sn-glycerol-3-phosphate acyltransferase
MKRIAFYLYQIYAWLVFIPLGLLFTALSGWVTVLVSMIWGPTFASRNIAARWARVVCWFTPVRVTVEGSENVDPERTYVVVCNHQSQYDIFVVYGWLQLDLKWVLKAELRKVPGVGIGCEKAGHIFVDRTNPEKSRLAVGAALDSVGDGVGVLFFAEGTRSTDGSLGRFKKGAFRVAASQNLPVLPITIVGTRDIQKPKSMMISPGKVRMIIHPAIEVEGGEGAQAIRELMSKTRAAIASGLPEDLR